MVFGFAAGAAQSTQDEAAQAEGQERRFENAIPAHVPVKVKLKNEQAFRDKGNRGWARSFEIDVKNTGTKPIYFMYMIVNLPDFVLEDGNSVGFQVRYGRVELVDLETPVQPDDMPVLPGESVTLKLSETQWKGYEALRGKKNKADAKKVEFRMQMINFGDGTGYESSAGVFLKAPPRKSALDGPSPGKSVAACQPPPGRAASAPLKFLKASYLGEPASPLRVDFLSPEPVTAARACNCQNIPNCFFGKLQCASHCPCGDNYCPYNG